MSQLIITVIAIVLASAYSLIFVNYLPAWSNAAAQVEVQVKSSFPKLELAYDVLTQAADGMAPDVLDQDDGGFVAQFLPLIKFAPAAPGGYTWVYGKHAEDGSYYAGMNYFCLAPTQAATEGVTRGLVRGAAIFSKHQAIVNTQCGATSSITSDSEWAGATLAITYYVSYVPGVLR